MASSAMAVVRPRGGATPPLEEAEEEGGGGSGPPLCGRGVAPPRCFFCAGGRLMGERKAPSGLFMETKSKPKTQSIGNEGDNATTNNVVKVL
jgi:hypothetical protein